MNNRIEYSIVVISILIIIVVIVSSFPGVIEWVL